MSDVERLETILRVSQFEASTPKEVLDYGLEQAVALTGSEIGYIFFYSEETRQFTLHAWSSKAMEMCTILEKPLVYDLDETGIWGEPVRQRKALIVNDFASPHPLKRGYPEGHAPVTRYMTIPVFSGGEIVAVAGIGNRAEPYDESDVYQLSLFMDALWRIVERHEAAAKLRASEARYHRLFSNLPVAVFEQDIAGVLKWMAGLRESGVIDLADHLAKNPSAVEEGFSHLVMLDTNDAAVKLFEAHSKADLMERVADTFPPEGVHAFKELLLQLWLGNNEFEYEFSAKSLNGKELFCLVRVVLPDRADGQAPNRAILVLSDLTERRLSERRMRLFSDIGKAILGAEPAATMARKAISRLIDIVPCAFIGVRVVDEESCGAPVLAHTGESGLPPEITGGIPAKGVWLEGISEGVPVLVEDLALLRGAATYVEALKAAGFRSLLVVPMIARVGLVGSIWLVARRPSAFPPASVSVVTAMANELAIGIQQAVLYEKSQAQAEELERRVAERTALLEAANKELESFCYSVSHDLRGPLRAIEGFSAITQEDWGHKLDDEARDNLGRIRNAAQRMAQLIEDLLALSRFTRGSLDLSEIDLSEMAREIAEKLHAGSPDRHIEFVVAPGVSCVGDSAMVKCLLQNLIENAWKFTSRTGQAKIEFGASDTGSGPVFHVKDNGCGFDMAYAKQLFLPFHRLHRADEFSGTGMGLATAHRIVTRHGGRIWAEGELGRGATIWFTLGR